MITGETLENLISSEVDVSRENTSYPLNASFTPIIAPALEKNKMRFFMPLLYLILGMVFFSLLRNIFDVYVLHMKIETSVVTAPLHTITAPTAGLIREIFVVAGQEVKKGAPLLKIENFDLERDLQLARIQAEDSKINIHYLQNLLAVEQQRLNLYKDIGTSRVISAQTTVDQLQQEVLTSEKQLARMRLLAHKHYVSAMELEQAQAHLHSAQERMKNAVALKTLEDNALGAVRKGIYFTGTKLEGMLGDIHAQIIDAQNKLKLNQDRVLVYQKILDKLTLLAPFDGRVTQLFKTAGGTTDTVNPILLLEPSQAKKQVVAYVTQEEITHIGSADKVKIYLPSLGKIYHGTVIDINRTAGFVDEIKGQYRWRDFQIDRSAMVTIDLDRDQRKFDREVTAGMPAIVYFSRKFTAL